MMKMKLVMCAGFLGLAATLTAVAVDKRAIGRATASVAEMVPASATDFGCAEPGTHGTVPVCWTQDETAICADPVGGFWAITDGLALAAGPCWGDEPAPLRLTFDPPPTSLAVHPATDDGYMICWTNEGAVGDPDAGITAIGDPLGIGVLFGGVVACDVHAAIELVRVE